MEKLQVEKFDCVVVDIGLTDMPAFDFIQAIRKELKREDLPVVAYTGRDLTKKESAQLNKIAEAVIVKDMTAMDRLLDETALYLHRNTANIPEDKRRRIENIRSTDAT